MEPSYSGPKLLSWRVNERLQCCVCVYVFVCVCGWGLYLFLPKSPILRVSFFPSISICVSVFFSLFLSLSGFILSFSIISIFSLSISSSVFLSLFKVPLSFFIYFIISSSSLFLPLHSCLLPSPPPLVFDSYFFVLFLSCLATPLCRFLHLPSSTHAECVNERLTER